VIRYQLSGGDGAAHGPAFGPIEVEELVQVDLGHEGPALVVRSIQSTSIDGDEVGYLLVSPRYEGDSLARIRAGECTVNVARVRCSAGEDPVHAVRQSAVDFLAVGTIQRLAT